MTPPRGAGRRLACSLLLSTVAAVALSIAFPAMDAWQKPWLIVCIICNVLLIVVNEQPL